MRNRCVIISGSPAFSGYEPQEGDLVIGCDAGYLHALAAGIEPAVFVGDFDSCPRAAVHAAEIVEAPSAKDDTDTMLAIKYALQKGLRDFLLLGATGGRLDHQTANLCACAYIAEHCGTCEMRDASNTVFAIKNSRLVLEKRQHCAVSVFAFSQTAAGVDLIGLKYPLENAVLENVFPRGVSNEFAAEQAVVQVRDGLLLVILSDTSDERR